MSVKAEVWPDRIRCLEEGCGKVFSGDSPLQAWQNWWAHVGLEHEEIF